MKGARALSPLEIQAVCGKFDGIYAIRNQTLFLLCANVGTRISEALNLNVGDVVQNGEVCEVLYLRRETVKPIVRSFGMRKIGIVCHLSDYHEFVAFSRARR